MKTITEDIINRSIVDVWEVMGNQFAQVHEWSSNFDNSLPGGCPKLPGINFAHRATFTDRGETIQELDTFDAKNYLLAYHITKGAPEVAEEASAVWSLSTIDNNKTKVTLEFELKPKGFVNAEMAQKIKKGLECSATEIAEELKYYLEMSRPHPRKIAKIKNNLNDEKN